EKLHSAVLRSLKLKSTFQWYELLDAVTSSDAGVKDLLFDQLVRNARPGTSHQYAAFLARAMDWRIVLTTNFDSLFERALADQDIPFTVYGLPESGDLPTPDLIGSNRALIKLHGTAFGLLAGSILNVPLDYARRERFIQY